MEENEEKSWVGYDVVRNYVYIILKYNNIKIPGHESLLQDCDCKSISPRVVSFSRHFVPLKAGAGCVQFLLRTSIPPPHVTLHPS